VGERVVVVVMVVGVKFTVEFDVVECDDE